MSKVSLLVNNTDAFTKYADLLHKIDGLDYKTMTYVIPLIVLMDRHDNAKRKVCLVLDRFDKNLLLSLYNQSHHVMQDFDKDTILNLQTAEWYTALKKRYNVGGSKLKLIMPDYATVFSGTIHYRMTKYISK